MERHQDNVESVPVVGQAHTHPMKVRQNVPCAHLAFLNQMPEKHTVWNALLGRSNQRKER